MKKTAWFVLFAFVIVLAAGCVVARPTFAPPPLKKEMRSRQPGANFVWISGHWKWTGNKYIWVTGHWVKKRRGKTWAVGHWKRQGNHWVWIRGRWR